MTADAEKNERAAEGCAAVVIPLCRMALSLSMGLRLRRAGPLSLKFLFRF